MAAHLRQALGKNVAVAVTGELPPKEREAWVAELGAHDGPRVLVSTDCMSEGINFQQHFTAVIHYDLSWNPTRHEQREGRVDRFGQDADVVRTVVYYGADTQIDEIVLDVLLRKHNQIRKRLGVSVPVPCDCNQVVEAIMEGVLLRSPDPEQLTLDVTARNEQQRLFDQWEDAAERDRRTRTMFAQRAIQEEDVVARELHAVRNAVGSAADVGWFVREVARSCVAQLTEHADAVTLDFTEAARPVRELLVGLPQRFTARFDLPVADDEVHLSRTHPLVERLATHVLDTALDPQLDAIACRCGVIYTTRSTAVPPCAATSSTGLAMYTVAVLPLAAAARAACLHQRWLDKTLKQIDEHVLAVADRLRDDDHGRLDAAVQAVSAVDRSLTAEQLPEHHRLQLAIAVRDVDAVHLPRRRLMRRFTFQIEQAQNDLESRQGETEAWAKGVDRAFGDHREFRKEVLVYLHAVVARARVHAATASALAFDGYAAAAFAQVGQFVSEVRGDFLDLNRRMRALASSDPGGRPLASGKRVLQAVTGELAELMQHEVRPALPPTLEDEIVFPSASPSGLEKRPRRLMQGVRLLDQHDA